MFFAHNGVQKLTIIASPYRGVGGSYDRFTNEWKKLDEADVLDYINEKQPSLGSTNCTYSSDFFEPLPHHIVSLHME